MQFEKKKKSDSEGLFKGIMLVYVILILHVLLIVGVGLLIIFFRGIINYTLWIFLGGSVVAIASCYLLYRRIKKEGKSLSATMRSPIFNGRPVEISFLGGFASVKMGAPTGQSTLESGLPSSQLQLEDSSTMRVRELSELARLFENNMITKNEYDKLKQRILDSLESINL